MKPISVWGRLGGHDGQRPMGKFGQDAKCVNDKQNTSSACSSSAFSEQIVFKLKTPSLLSDAFITQNRRINKLLTQIVHDSNLKFSPQPADSKTLNIYIIEYTIPIINYEKST